MAYPKEIKELGEPWTMIYSIKDPMQFIDMLAAQSYFCGQFNGKIPVTQTRTVFLTWMKRYAPNNNQALEGEALNEYLDKKKVTINIDEFGRSLDFKAAPNQANKEGEK